jgi:serine protease 16
MVRTCNDIYLLLMVIVSCLVGNDAIRPILRSEIRDFMTEETEAAITSTMAEDDYPDVQELQVEQNLDHIDVSNTQTFNQNYFYSSRYVNSKKITPNNNVRTSSKKKKKTYAFLCMGGEGPSMDKSVLVDSVHCSGDMLELASKLHKERGDDVHVFALEHRYYGKSYPSFADGSSPVENQNLVYLSSEQALEDVKHFVSYATTHHLNMVMVRWVTFGGSYPGMLAAWSRLEMPHLIYAAVSNSAPVQATVDMYQYNDYVSQILKNKSIGGSNECLRIISKGHEQIGHMLEKSLLIVDSYARDSVLDRIASRFNICDKNSLKSIKNVQNFLSESVIDIPMQSNDPSCEEDNCNIEKLCGSILEKHALGLSPMNVLADIRFSQRDGNDDYHCDNIEWKDQLEFLSSTKAKKGGTRSWLWQTCNEFGFYQTCHQDSDCPFARGFHGLDQDFEICQVAFNVTSQTVPANVYKTRELYKGWNMNTTRVFNVNGEVDPWSTLAITKDHGTQKLPNDMVQGASHHFWTHAVKDTDTESVKKARDKIHHQVITWLDQDAHNYETISVK